MSKKINVDYFWHCKRCGDNFEKISQRYDSDEGYYNCCPDCKSASVVKVWVVDGIEETFSTEREAMSAAFDLMDGEQA